MIVEDEAVIRSLLGRIFAATPYDLTLAGSISEGIEKVNAMDFHLLVTDLRLPDGSGTTVIRHFREKFPSSGVIMMTGSLTPEDRMNQVSDLGIIECLHKPFDLEELRHSVSRALGD